jgi:hypothetical protein
MPSDSKITKLILQLTKATVDNEMKWAKVDPPRSFSIGTDDTIPFLLRAEYKGQRLALFERRFQGYNAEDDSSFWTGDDVLAILDPKDGIIWEHRENSSAIANLIKVAKESAANIDSLLDSLLG